MSSAPAGSGRTLAGDLLRAGHDVRVLDASADAPRPTAGRARGPRHPRLAARARRARGRARRLRRASPPSTDDDALNAVVALAARRELRVPLAVAVIGNPARAEALAGLGVARRVPDRADRARAPAHAGPLRASRASCSSAATPASTAPSCRPASPARTLRELERPGELVPVAVERDGRVLLAAPELELARATCCTSPPRTATSSPTSMRP